jgi:hypothetical protein
MIVSTISTDFSFSASILVPHGLELNDITSKHTYFVTRVLRSFYRGVVATPYCYTPYPASFRMSRAIGYLLR